MIKVKCFSRKKITHIKNILSTPCTHTVSLPPQGEKSSLFTRSQCSCSQTAITQQGDTPKTPPMSVQNWHWIPESKSSLHKILGIYNWNVNPCQFHISQRLERPLLSPWSSTPGRVQAPCVPGTTRMDWQSSLQFPCHACLSFPLTVPCQWLSRNDGKSVVKPTTK